MLKEHAAIRNGIQKRLPKIKGRMPSHGQPEVASPSQSESEEKPGGDHPRGSHVALAGIPEMSSAKQNGKENRRRPESNPACQSELRVAAEQILFRKSDRDERHEPQPAPPRQFQSVQGNGAERISAKRGNRAEQQTDFHKAEKTSLPEQFSKSPLPGQSINVYWAALKF